MSFTQLAESILGDAKILDEFVAASDLPPPSLDAGGPAMTRFTTKESIHAHASLLASTHRLSFLAQGPVILWMGSMNGAMGDAMTSAAVCHFGIAHHVPLEGEASFEDVAKKSGMALRDFKCVVRYAMTNYIFCEPRPGFIKHTASSKVLVENKLIRSLAGIGSDELLPALDKEKESMQKYPGSEEPTQSAWALANKATNPMFAELAIQHPARAENMAFGMEALASMYQDSVIVDNYDWGKLGSATIVDVGGGKGLVSRTLAKHFPDLSFIVQDLEDTANAGRETCPEELRGRIKYMTHDFFSEQPVKGADVYFFRSIFHDWPEKYCVKILRNLTPALRKGSRVVIYDPHTMDPGTMAPWQERQTRAASLRMKLLFNSYDRESGEWPPLFEKADSRFRIVTNKFHDREPGNDVGQTIAVVEAVWDG